MTTKPPVYFAAVHQYLKKAGMPIPLGAAWIAASALQYGASILTKDHLFSLIPLLLVVIR